MNKKFIIENISKYVPVTRETTPLAAAILILIMSDEKKNKFLIVTKRSESLVSYAGDYCFPGGMCEPEDVDFKNTVIREVHEELNLNSDHYQIIGQLDDFIDRFGNVVRPFVAVISQSDFEKNFKNANDEIAEVFYFPLEDLLKFEEDKNLELITKRHPSYRYIQNRVVIWGLTASIMVHFGKIGYGSDFASS